MLDRAIARRLDASDCILPRPRRRRTGNDVPEAGCIRYSALPEIPAVEMVSDGSPSGLVINELSCTHRNVTCFSDQFGEHGCGVLHPAAPEAIRFGAEDGGEMGAYHRLRYSARQAAIMDKANDYLPVGIEAVLIPDETLVCPPPQSVTG